MHDVSAQAANLVEKLVLREIEDVSSALKVLGAAVEFAQTAQRMHDCGEPLEDLHSPFEPDATSTTGRTAEIVTAWRDHCRAVRVALLPALGPLDAGTNQATIRSLVGTQFRTLADESMLAGLAEATTLASRLALVAESDVALDDLADLLTCALAWIDDACAVLKEDPQAPLPPLDPALLASMPEIPAMPTAAPSSAAPPVPVAPVASGAVVIDLPSDRATLGEFVTEARDHLETAERAMLALDKDPTNRDEMNALFRAFHTVKGVAGFLNLEPIVTLTHAAETLLDRVRSGALPLTPATLNVVLGARDMLAQLVDQVVGGRTASRAAFDANVSALRSAASGQCPTVAPAPATPSAAPMADAPAPAAAPTEPARGSAAPTANPMAAVARTEQTVKVTTERLDSLLDLVGELVIAQLMVIQDPLVERIPEQRVHRNISHMARIVRELHAVAMCLRMETLKSTFQRMARIVRDLHNKSGKLIDLVVEGEDTELDRTIVAAISDPLVHMVRNACDHGLEMPDERVAKGKPANGTLVLRAYHTGGHICIEIADDGRGLQREKILKKCVERGLIAPERKHDEIPDSEVWGYIMLPGFSTAERITDISGRGVGMDIVKRNIEALHGKLEIASTPGRGTTFRIELPLTTAIIDGMVVRAKGERFVIPTLAIERTFRPEPGQIKSVLGRGELALYRGETLPVHRLDSLFGIGDGVGDLSEGILMAVDAGGRRACLAVDEILGQQQVVIKSLGEDRWRSRGVSGGAILGDGRVALILDVNGVICEARGTD
ncbi:MAG: chemotaxis protein CheA [Phycisphaerae bacterium]|nr:chemotaxis protein CheA [Phycisphaerae bacterium]